MKRSLKQSFKESEYKSILRETISVIESARNNAATAIITCTNEMHWMVGKLLYERKLESTHG